MSQPCIEIVHELQGRVHTNRGVTETLRISSLCFYDRTPVRSGAEIAVLNLLTQRLPGCAIRRLPTCTGMPHRERGRASFI